MGSEIFTKEDYLKILENKLKTKCFVFKNAECNPISNEAEGVMGEHYILKLNSLVEDEEETTEDFFC